MIGTLLGKPLLKTHSIELIAKKLISDWEKPSAKGVVQEEKADR